MHGSRLQQCRCSPLQIEKYLAKVSGPLFDRIAIHVTVQPVDVDMWRSSARKMTSADMREMVIRARAIQARRFENVNGVDCNARLPEGMFSTHCVMEPSAEALFVRAQKSLLVSARARTHIVHVARTIADLEGSERIAERHLAEAVQYRGRRAWLAVCRTCLGMTCSGGASARLTIDGAGQPQKIVSVAAVLLGPVHVEDGSMILRYRDC